MSKIIYLLDKNNTTYNYDIFEDTIIYHYSINSSSLININLKEENINLYYYYNCINYEDNELKLFVKHLANNTHSEVFCHGVNIKDNKLTFNVTGNVLKKYSKCICNQDNQIINFANGKSTILPILLIDNYDVVSNHSAYIGKFKDEEVFYLMSRGINKDVANKLLLNGFLINNCSIDKSKIEDFLLEIEKI